MRTECRVSFAFCTCQTAKPATLTVSALYTDFIPTHNTTFPSFLPSFLPSFFLPSFLLSSLPSFLPPFHSSISTTLLIIIIIIIIIITHRQTPHRPRSLRNSHPLPKSIHPSIICIHPSSANKYKKKTAQKVKIKNNPNK